MRAFAELLDGLAYTPGRLAKLRRMGDFFRREPDPERGWALAALTGGLVLETAKPGGIRAMIEARVDPTLFHLSYDFVGDLAETVALVWPDRGPSNGGPALSEIVETLAAAPRDRVPGLVADWLDAAQDSTERWALLKLITGALRVGVSGRLAKTALAEAFAVPLDEIEEVWHGLQPPYAPLFAWLDGRAPRPDVGGLPTFRPMMLSHPLEDTDAAKLDWDLFSAEWKWDGIRVQLVSRHGERRVYSRTGDEIGGAFPDVVALMNFDAVLDGELLVHRAGQAGPPYDPVAPFNDLQQRLNRKVVDARTVARFPAFVRLYDMLFDGDEDIRSLPFTGRRRRLEAWYAAAPRPGFDLSPLLADAGRESLDALRANLRDQGIEGLMLKRRDSAYVAGRPMGQWFKWKRDPHTLDTVLMYAQRGHGKRSSFYSDYTFGAWREGELVPVGKAYFGFTDEELRQLDKWVRDHTRNRFGPVREVEPGLVLEVAFDSVHRSNRHKSGVAMRFPRVHRIRWDKPPEEADRLETLESMIRD